MLPRKFFFLKKGKSIKPNLSPDKRSGQFGNVDFVNKEGIGGWFVNLDDPENNLLTIEINGKKVGQIKPEGYREDINRLANRPLKSAFFIPWAFVSLDEELKKAPLWKVEVKFKDIPLAGSKELKGKELEEVIRSASRRHLVVSKPLEDEEIEGYVDSVLLKRNFVEIEGWLKTEKSPLKVEVQLGNKKAPLNYPLPRKDLEEKRGKDYLYTGFHGKVAIPSEPFPAFRLLVYYPEKVKEIELGKLNLKAYKNKWGECNFRFSELLFRVKEKEVQSLVPVLDEPIDIIVPVFNGFAHVKRLLESLLKNTQEPFRLIIIDDASTDYRVVDYLRELAQKYANKIFLFRNDRNMGFTHSVNRGLKEVQGHAVILNSDTVVPPGWLTRLMEPILKNHKVASVTPFTNAGTICSFPEFLKDNELPEDLTVEEVDAFFNSLSGLGCEIRLPTGVGFCMALNREALKEVGLFDERNFPRGYGEENDWCMRALKKGYKHLIAYNLFVAHEHGGSFTSEEKKKLMERHLNRLKELYPQYEELIRSFIEEDPLRELRNAIGIKLFSSKKPTTLVVDHELGGGANIYRKNLIKERLKEDRFVLLYTESYLSIPKLYGFYKDFQLGPEELTAEELLSFLREIRPEEVFINELVSFSNPLKLIEQLVKLKEEKGFRLVFAIHDYYAICPSYNLLNEKGLFCGVPLDPNICNKCLEKNPYSGKPEIKRIESWRKKWETFLQACDRIICFSENSKKLLLRAYPSLKEEKLLIIPHRLDLELKKPHPKRLGNTLTVGVIGAINYQKGLSILFELAKRIKEEHLPVKIVVVGYTSEPIPKELQDIIKVTGPYKREELPAIIEREGIEVILFPSVVPETFSFVLEEVMNMELPIVAFDIGAQEERVKRYEKGKIVKYLDVNQIIRFIKDWIK